MSAAWLLLATSLERAEILAVRCEAVAGGAALKLLSSAALVNPQGERSGETFVLQLAATVAPALPLPDPIPPLRSLRLETTATGSQLVVALAAGTIVETRSEGSLVTMVFRSREAAERAAAKRDVESLYPLLFPTSVAGAPETGETAPGALGGAVPTKDPGFTFGPLIISPALVLRYVDGDSTFLETPRPVRARYLELQPRLGVTTASTVVGGDLSLRYEPRFRIGESEIPILTRPSHYLTARYDHPVGTAWRVALGDDFWSGSIETQIVDPGREYFYNPSRFQRNQTSLSLRSESENRLNLNFGASRTIESVDPNGGYFSNEKREANAVVRYETGVSRHVTLGYAFEHTPAPATRPLAEMRAHTLAAGLDGELTPLWNAVLAVGYRRELHPQAPLAGRVFNGITYSGRLRREFASNGSLTLNASRSTYLSAFEQNAFYVANLFSGELTQPLPWAFQAILGGNLQRNSYRLDAATLREPRRDRLYGWTIGLGRSVTSWSYIRADYNAETRNSNVPGLSARTHSFVVQAGIGATGLLR